MSTEDGLRGPSMQATGFFRAAKEKGKWWLVTPSGHLFLSFGSQLHHDH